MDPDGQNQADNEPQDDDPSQFGPSRTGSAFEPVRLGALLDPWRRRSATASDASPPGLAEDDTAETTTPAEAEETVGPELADSEDTTLAVEPAASQIDADPATAEMTKAGQEAPTVGILENTDTDTETEPGIDVEPEPGIDVEPEPEIDSYVEPEPDVEPELDAEVIQLETDGPAGDAEANVIDLSAYGGFEPVGGESLHAVADDPTDQHGRGAEVIDLAAQHSDQDAESTDKTPLPVVELNDPSDDDSAHDHSAADDDSAHDHSAADDSADDPSAADDSADDHSAADDSAGDHSADIRSADNDSAADESADRDVAEDDTPELTLADDVPAEVEPQPAEDDDPASDQAPVVTTFSVGAAIELLDSTTDDADHTDVLLASEGAGAEIDVPPPVSDDEGVPIPDGADRTPAVAEAGPDTPGMPALDDLRAMAIDLDDVDAILEQLDNDPDSPDLDAPPVEQTLDLTLSD